MTPNQGGANSWTTYFIGSKIPPYSQQLGSYTGASVLNATADIRVYVAGDVQSPTVWINSDGHVYMDAAYGRQSQYTVDLGLPSGNNKLTAVLLQSCFDSFLEIYPTGQSAWGGQPTSWAVRRSSAATGSCGG